MSTTELLDVGLSVGRRRFRTLPRRVQAESVRIVGPRARWSIYVEDPNGYTVELHAN